MTVGFSPALQAPVFSARKPAAPRFGRDAIFERNDRFEILEATDAERTVQQREVLTSLLQQPANDVKDKAAAAREIARASESLYDGRGRIRGSASLGLALRAAELEYNLLKKAPDATPVETALSGLKLANAKTAVDAGADRHEADTLALFDESFKALAEAGYDPKPGEADPVYIHALYNRAAYVLNNDLYRETRNAVGEEEMLLSSVGHEGLVLNLAGPDHMTIADNAVKALREQLPKMEKAIELARGMKGDNIALVEYLSGLGEVYHILAHMDNEPGEWAWDMDKYKAISRQSLDAFVEAFKVLDAMQDSGEELTPRHVLLAEKLGRVKIPHLCGHQHQIGMREAREECRTLDVGSARLLEWMDGKTTRPPANEAERFYERMTAPMMMGPQVIMLGGSGMPAELEQLINDVLGQMGAPQAQGRRGRRRWFGR